MTLPRPGFVEIATECGYFLVERVMFAVKPQFEKLYGDLTQRAALCGCLVQFVWLSYRCVSSSVDQRKKRKRLDQKKKKEEEEEDHFEMFVSCDLHCYHSTVCHMPIFPSISLLCSVLEEVVDSLRHFMSSISRCSPPPLTLHFSRSLKPLMLCHVNCGYTATY